MRELAGRSGAWLIAAPTDDEHRLQLAITVQPPQRDASATRYHSLVVSSVAKAFTGFSCVDGKSFVIAGRKSALLRCKYRVGQQSMIQVHWLVPGEPRSYAFVWTCREADLAAAQSTLDACANTIEIGKEPAAGKR